MTLQGWRAGHGGTLEQVHYYAKTDEGEGELPRRGATATPCFVGEFATRPDRPWPGMNPPRTDVLSRLQYIEQHGYKAAFLWSAHGKKRDASGQDVPDDATLWAADVQTQIGKYNGRTECRADGTFSPEFAPSE